MSLVGSEVDVSIDKDFSPPVCVSDDELSVEGSHLQSQDHHPPPSPPRAAEHLFLHGLETQSISAAALAQQIHQSHRHSSGWTGTSVNTDDFASAVGWMTAADDNDSFFGGAVAAQPISARSSDTLTPFAESDDDDDSDCYEQIFQKDVLSRNYDLSEVDDEPYQDSIMSTTATPTSKASTTPTKFFPTEAPTHVDAAEKVYDTAKGAWAWGKGVSVITPFLGLAESVAGKFAVMAGSNLGSVDGAVVDQLHTLDEKVLNPAITAIIGAILGAAGKSEDIFKPIIIAILKPLGLIKDSAENPELTTVPGVTVQ